LIRKQFKSSSHPAIQAIQAIQAIHQVIKPSSHQVIKPSKPFIEPLLHVGGNRVDPQAVADLRSERVTASSA